MKRMWRGIGTKVELVLETDQFGIARVLVDGTPVLEQVGNVRVGCSLYAGGKHGTVVTAQERRPRPRSDST